MWLKKSNWSFSIFEWRFNTVYQVSLVKADVRKISGLRLYKLAKAAA